AEEDGTGRPADARHGLPDRGRISIGKCVHLARAPKPDDAHRSDIRNFELGSQQLGPIAHPVVLSTVIHTPWPFISGGHRVPTSASRSHRPTSPTPATATRCPRRLAD